MLFLPPFFFPFFFLPESFLHIVLRFCSQFIRDRHCVLPSCSLFLISVFSSRSGLSTPGGLPGLGRPVGLGLGPSSGPLPSANQNLGVVSLPQPSMLQHHPSAYDQYPEASSYGG